MDVLSDLITDYTLRTVALGAATLGIVGGGLGTYAVLRGQSLLGDAISHAALPGIALAFLLTGSKEPLVLMLGAGAAGVVATLAILGVTETTRVKYDSALALMLAVFFGFGLVLLTYIQRYAGASSYPAAGGRAGAADDRARAARTERQGHPPAPRRRRSPPRPETGGGTRRSG